MKKKLLLETINKIETSIKKILNIVYIKYLLLL